MHIDFMSVKYMLAVGMKDKRASVVAEMKRLQAETEVITKIFEDEDISKSIQSTRSVSIIFVHLSPTAVDNIPAVVIGCRIRQKARLSFTFFTAFVLYFLN